jgi:hypothetical protein
MPPLSKIDAELKSWLSDDWKYAYKRVGPRAEVEYEARHALRALEEFEQRWEQFCMARDEYKETNEYSTG